MDESYLTLLGVTFCDRGAVYICSDILTYLLTYNSPEPTLRHKSPKTTGKCVTLKSVCLKMTVGYRLPRVRLITRIRDNNYITSRLTQSGDSLYRWCVRINNTGMQVYMPSGRQNWRAMPLDSELVNNFIADFLSHCLWLIFFGREILSQIRNRPIRRIKAATHTGELVGN